MHVQRQGVLMGRGLGHVGRLCSCACWASLTDMLLVPLPLPSTQARGYAKVPAALPPVALPSPHSRRALRAAERC